MQNREAFLMWNEISHLVSTALGLSMLADYGCAGAILDKHDRETMQDATSTAAVILLRKADSLLVDLEQYVNLIPHQDDEARKDNESFAENNRDNPPAPTASWRV